MGRTGRGGLTSHAHHADCNVSIPCICTRDSHGSDPPLPPSPLYVTAARLQLQHGGRADGGGPPPRGRCARLLFSGCLALWRCHPAARSRGFAALVRLITCPWLSVSREHDAFAGMARKTLPLVDDVHRPQMRPHIQALRECASSGSEARCAGQVRDQERSRTTPRVSDKTQGQYAPPILAADLQPLAHAVVTALHIPPPSICPADAITAALRSRPLSDRPAASEQLPCQAPCRSIAGPFCTC